MDGWKDAQQRELKFWVSLVRGDFPGKSREDVRQHIYDAGTRRIAHFQLSEIEGRVLDAGCAIISLHEGRPNVAVVAIDPLLDDFAREMPDISKLGQVANVEYRCCKIQDVEETDFDVIWCTNVLDHSDDWQDMISHMARVCKRGGLLLLGSDVRHSKKTLSGAHISQVTEALLLYEVCKHFDVEWHTPIQDDDRYYFCLKGHLGHEIS
ncbi:MAG: class I SAM-dependent methyltransferase [Gammaproteobacteria bacterium]|nr:class I SAM-dependent methyltransferase [Gammaproteobacteria bacterium]